MKKVLSMVLVVFMLCVSFGVVHANSSDGVGPVNVLIDGFLFDMDKGELIVDAYIANLSNQHISELTGFSYKIIDLDRGLDVTQYITIDPIKPDGGIKIGSSIKHKFITYGINYPYPIKNLGIKYNYNAIFVGDAVNLGTDVKVYYNGTRINFDIPPKIKNDRTMLPVRFVSETLGANVSWDEKTRTVTIVHGGNIIKLQIGSEKVISNATEYTLEAPAEIDNGRTMVPVRFIVEMLGKTVQWSEDNRMVIISD